MEIMGWSSWNMLKIYEKKYLFNSDAKDKEKTDSVNNLLILSKSVSGIVPTSPELRPTKNALIRLVSVFSNVAIGKIYGMSDVAVKSGCGNLMSGAPEESYPRICLIMKSIK